VEVIKQPPDVMHRLADVGKSIPPFTQGSYGCDYSFSGEVATAKVSAPCSTSIEVQSVEHVQPVVPMKQDNKVATTISLVPKSNVVMTVVSKDVAEEVEPLNGLNMQLKRVYGGACMTMERGQRWSLFQM
jgi:hypothetical protein